MLFFSPSFHYKPAKFNAWCARVIHISPNLYLPAWHFYLIHCELAPQLLLLSDLRCLKQRMERGCGAAWQSAVAVKGVPLLSGAPLEGFSSQLQSLFGGPVRWPDQHRPFFTANRQWFCQRQCVDMGREKLCCTTDWWFCLCFFFFNS